MFTDAYVETNYSEMENDEVKPVNAKLDDKIDVAVETVTEDNNVKVDSDREKYAEDDAAETIGCQERRGGVGRTEASAYDKINVDKMNFADANAEKHESAGSYFETSRNSSRGRRSS